MMTLSKRPSERLAHRQLKSPNWRTNIYLLWSDRTVRPKVHCLTQPTRPAELNGCHLDQRIGETHIIEIRRSMRLVLVVRACLAKSVWSFGRARQGRRASRRAQERVRHRNATYRPDTEWPIRGGGSIREWTKNHRRCRRKGVLCWFPKGECTGGRIVPANGTLEGREGGRSFFSRA